MFLIPGLSSEMNVTGYWRPFLKEKFWRILRTAELTFSLHRVGLLDEGWVCVALETLWTLLVVSRTELGVPPANAASFLGRFSAAVSAGSRKANFRNAADGPKGISIVL